MARQRFTLGLSHELADFLEKAAKVEGVSESEILRQGLSVLVAYDQQMQLGRVHLGCNADPSRMDAELTGILSKHQALAREARDLAEEAALCDASLPASLDSFDRAVNYLLSQPQAD